MERLITVKLKELFYIKYGVNLELSNCIISNSEKAINFVSRTSENNGVSCKVKPLEDVTPQAAGTLSCAGGGSVLSTFVQNEPYYSGRDLYILTPKKEMTLNEKLFWCTAIKKNAYRYSYGRQANKTLGDLELPDSIPEFVSTSVMSVPSTTNSDSVSIPLHIKKWKDFYLSSLFNIQGTMTTPPSYFDSTIIKGDYPYVTTRSKNNGVANFYDFYTETGNVITIDSAVAGFPAFQIQSFSASDHVEKLVPLFNMTTNIALFIVTLLKNEMYRYSYGRKCNQVKLKDTIVKLPEKNGMPDWEFVENYVNTLPYADVIQQYQKDK